MKATMNKFLCALLSLFAIAGCNKQAEPTTENFTKGMNVYMEQHGDFCLAKSNWPIDVTQHEMDTRGRNALQMPVLEKVGLTKSSVATIDVTDEQSGATKNIKVMRYDLTDEGKKYYLTKNLERKKSDGSMQTVPGDFCAAKLTLDKIVGWDKPTKVNGKDSTTVTYTYNVDPAPWTANADVQKVFPIVAYIVQGAKKVQLKEAFELTPTGWQAAGL
jgi:hypothetical protein